MDRAEYNKIIREFKNNEKRLKSLKKGDFIYEHDLHDPIEFSYFMHEVVSIDLDEMCVNTIDHSQNSKKSKLSSFYTEDDMPFKASKNEK